MGRVGEGSWGQIRDFFSLYLHLISFIPEKSVQTVENVNQRVDQVAGAQLSGKQRREPNREKR